jgi:hypothetical protein
VIFGASVGAGLPPSPARWCAIRAYSSRHRLLVAVGSGPCHGSPSAVKTRPWSRARRGISAGARDARCPAGRPPGRSRCRPASLV